MEARKQPSRHEGEFVARIAELLRSADDSPDLLASFEDRRQRLGLLADLLRQTSSLVAVRPRALAALIRSTAGIKRANQKYSAESGLPSTAKQIEALLGRALAHKRPSIGDVIREQNFALDGLAALVESASTVEPVSSSLLASSIRNLAELEPAELSRPTPGNRT